MSLNKTVNYRKTVSRIVMLLGLSVFFIIPAFSIINWSLNYDKLNVLLDPSTKICKIEFTSFQDYTSQQRSVENHVIQSEAIISKLISAIRQGKQVDNLNHPSIKWSYSFKIKFEDTTLNGDVLKRCNGQVYVLIASQQDVTLERYECDSFEKAMNAAGIFIEEKKDTGFYKVRKDG